MFARLFNVDFLISLLISVPAALIALTVHEYCHGYVAYKCGDNTAKMYGRLSLNPLKHLNIMGTLMLIFTGFGYAEPVPINPRNFRNPKKDIAKTAAAGPISNLILGLLFSVFYYLTLFIYCKATDMNTLIIHNSFGSMPMVVYSQQYLITQVAQVNGITDPSVIMITLLSFFSACVRINIGLAIFNFIPVPPLDGSKVLSYFLPPLKAAKLLSLERYANFVFIGIVLVSVLFPNIFNIVMFPVRLVRGGFELLYELPWRLLF